MSERPDPDVGDAPPEAPRAPADDECCRSGCRRCVYDIYWAAMERYETALEAWQRRQSPP